MSRDYSKLSKNQIDALCEVAFPLREFVQLRKRVADSLLRRDLISIAVIVDRGLRVEHHVMTIPQHMDFCAWCAEHPE